MLVDILRCILMGKDHLTKVIKVMQCLTPVSDYSIFQCTLKFNAVQGGAWKSISHGSSPKERFILIVGLRKIVKARASWRAIMAETC